MKIEKYIQKRCEEDGIEFDINKLNKLNEIIDKYDPQIKEYINDVHLVFTIWDKDFHHPNGNSTFRHSIWLNGEWAYIFTHNDCGYTHKELFGFVEDTIGHELGHKMKAEVWNLLNMPRHSVIIILYLSFMKYSVTSMLTTLSIQRILNR